MADDDRRRSDRRGFFRLGLEELRTRVLTAASELGRAFEDESPAGAGGMRTEVMGDREFHRARVRRPADATRRHVRPPGAVEERRFLELCTRCTECVQACPEGSIHRAGPQWGPAVELTPVIFPQSRPCFLCRDVPCAAACPTGALVPIPVEAIRIGTASIEPALCLVAAAIPCQACYDACPLPDVAIAIGPDEIPRVDPAACNGCGQCASACRSYPRAVQVAPA